MNWLMQLEIVGEVALAMLLGGVIGFEREVADKPAGFRTQMLVAGAACLLVGLGDAMLLRFLAEGKSNQESAALLSLSPKSVETYRSRLMTKLDIHDLATLIRFAIKHGVTPL